jgi:hypothetical protein
MTIASSVAHSLPSMGRAAELGEAQPNLASGACPGESRGGVKPPPRSAQRPRPFPGRRLARDIFATMERDFMPIHPDDILGPEMIATVNRLLARGARYLANAPGWWRAKPFPASGPTTPLARDAYVALLKLLDCIEPRLSRRAPIGSPGSPTPADETLR